MSQTKISLKEFASVRRKAPESIDDRHLNPLMIIWITSDCWKLDVSHKSLSMS